MEDIQMSQMEIIEIDAYRHWKYYERLLWQEFEQIKMFKVFEDTD